MIESNHLNSREHADRFYTDLIKDMERTKQIEDVVWQKSDLMRMIHDNMDILVVVLGMGGEVIYFNPACERLLGYTAIEFKARLMTGQLELPKEIGTIKALFRNILDGSRSGHYDSQWVASNGETYTIAWSIKPLFNQERAAECILATGIDITHLRTVETLLEWKELLLQSLIDSIPDLIFYKLLALRGPRKMIFVRSRSNRASRVPYQMNFG